MFEEESIFLSVINSTFNFVSCWGNSTKLTWNSTTAKFCHCRLQTWQLLRWQSWMPSWVQRDAIWQLTKILGKIDTFPIQTSNMKYEVWNSFILENFQSTFWLSRSQLWTKCLLKRLSQVKHGQINWWDSNQEASDAMLIPLIHSFHLSNTHLGT